MAEENRVFIRSEKSLLMLRIRLHNKQGLVLDVQDNEPGITRLTGREKKNIGSVTIGWSV
jgi:acyl-CoA-binding protein